jgi:GNAT superfamily N-acetyltransferase
VPVVALIPGDVGRRGRPIPPGCADGARRPRCAAARGCSLAFQAVDLSLLPPTPEEFTRLYEQTGWGDVSLTRAATALAGTWIVCCARDGTGALVGMGRLIGDGALHAFVTELIVDERARNAGLGARILARLVAESRARGVEDVQLFAADGRAAFYERNGFAARAAGSPGMDVLPAG